MRTTKTLITLGGCPGWSESSLGANTILLVLSWGSLNGATCSTLCLKLPLVLYIVWVNNEGSGETAWMPRFAWAIAVPLYDKYQAQLSTSLAKLSDEVYGQLRPKSVSSDSEAPQSPGLMCIITTAGVCKTLCSQHLLAPKYGQICTVP